MRQSLTFLGFLKQYVKELSGEKTLSVRKLVRCCEHNARLREPLFLYVLETEKLGEMKAEAELQDDETLLKWASEYTKDIVTARLETKSEELPERMLRVWNSYLVAKNKTANDNHLKDLMRSRILQMQKEKSISNYRLYTDLAMNAGNLNCWLKHGNAEKVSLDKARLVLDYVRQA